MNIHIHMWEVSCLRHVKSSQSIVRVQPLLDPGCLPLTQLATQRGVCRQPGIERGVGPDGLLRSSAEEAVTGAGEDNGIATM
jgi:hypothetical protein